MFFMFSVPGTIITVLGKGIACGAASGLVYKLLKNSGPFEISVRIGSELGQDIFSDCSLVTATYRIGTMPVGTMGVIGPTRMPYGKVVSVLDYMSKSLGSILTNLLEED